MASISEKEQDRQPGRYHRQIKFLGEDKQKILRTKKVLVIGAGGLGSPLLYYLTAAGVGKIIIIDDDIVKLDNLNRQILYGTDDIGKPKVDTAIKRLSALNPEVKFEGYRERITYENYQMYCSDIDYLVDASDNLTTKFTVNDIGLKENIPFTIAGVENMQGQIISVEPRVSACYRCVFGGSDHLPPENWFDGKKLPKDLSERKSTKKRRRVIGIIGFTCGVLGSLEAAEVLKHLLETGKKLLNTMLMVDLENMECMRINIKKDEKCFCSQ